MADTQSVISDVKLFLEKLKADLPEVFGPQTTAGSVVQEGEEAAPVANRVLYGGDLLPAHVYLTPDQPSGVEFNNSAFHIYLQQKTDDPAALLTTWMREKAKEVLAEKTKNWAEKIGVSYNQIFIKDQRTLWASCSAQKNINYTYRLLKMPPAVQDYLIIHELCHLVHMNHGEAYWQLVGQFCADYKLHRRWLNEHKDAVFADEKLTYREDPAENLPEGPSH